jgi:hypothetical protein
VLNVYHSPAGSEHLVPLLLDGTARQHTGVYGFDKWGLDCGNVDLAFAHCDYMVGRFGRACLDREEEGPFTGRRHTQVSRAGAYVILHLGSYLWEKRFGRH